MAGVGFGPIFIPDLGPEFKRIGQIIRLWFEPCGGNPFAYLSYIGPLLNAAFWTAAPIDYKHAYHFAAGKSWVKTARGVAAAVTADAPVVAGVADAFLDFAAAADTLAWWWWVGHGLINGILEWGSLAELANGCAPGRFVGYAISGVWALTGPNKGVYGPVLWNAINNPLGVFGVRNGFLDKDYKLTQLGFTIGSISIVGGGFFGQRLMVTPVFAGGPDISQRMFLDPDPEGMLTDDLRAMATAHSTINPRAFNPPELLLGDGPTPPFPALPCNEVTPPDPGTPVPNCFGRVGQVMPAGSPIPSAVWSDIPDFAHWHGHPLFVGIIFEPQVTHSGEITLAVNGQCHWAFVHR